MAQARRDQIAPRAKDEPLHAPVPLEQRLHPLVHDRRIHCAPDLMVEVLSPGNSAEEMANKRAMYAHGGVAEYVEVDPATRTLLPAAPGTHQ